MPPFHGKKGWNLRAYSKIHRDIKAVVIIWLHFGGKKVRTYVPTAKYIGTFT